jgi:hypothetical protein
MTKHFSKISQLRSGAVFLSSLYFFLLGAASFCMFAHAAPLNVESHNSQHTTNHSTLCAWACQVSSYSSTGQIASTPETKPDLFVVTLLSNSSTITLQHDGSLTQSRAPPRVFFSL